MSEYNCILPYLKRKAAGTVAIFLRKDTRELFDDDARLVADELLMTDVGRKICRLDDRDLTVLTINKAQCNRVIRDLLLILRCRVEVYEENSEGSGFEVTQKGDLSNYDDFASIVENCVELGELSTVMSIRLHGKDEGDDNKVSVVLCNPHDMRITVAEFSDTPNFYYLSECIQNTMPRECIVFNSDADSRPVGYKALMVCLKRTNLPMQEAALPNKEMDILKAEFLSLLLKIGNNEPSLSKNILTAAVSLFRQMRLLPDYKGKFVLVEYKSAGHLHLDTTAVRALELFSLVNDADDEPSRGVGTLYDHLNKCRSDPGRRLLRSWIRRPLSDVRRINERLDVVEALTESHSCRNTLSDSLLRQVPDIFTVERRMLQKKATLHDCYRVHRLIDLLKRFESVLSDLYDEHEEEKGAAVKELLYVPVQKAVSEFEPFTRVLEEFVDLDYADETGEYRIKPEKDEDLKECWDKIQKFEEKALKLLKSFASKTSLDNTKVDLTPTGFVFRGNLKDEKAINRIGVEVLDVTRAGGIRFTTRELRRLSEEMEEIQTTYQGHQARLTEEVMDIAQEHTSKLPQLNDILAVIDVLVAFAVVGVNSSNGYTRPELLEKGTGVLKLIGCRHPVLEEKHDLEYIANDVNLEYETIDGTLTGRRFAVVTGANMGGKSTYLRSAGLTVIMAQMGCFVPCESARFSVVDGVHTRVGASDFQCNGVSTFMAEMADCGAILDAAKPTSLVLIDELGRGTSTHDGFCLAWLVAKHLLTDVGCFCLFATHYHEMSVLNEAYPEDVVNLKAETHVDSEGNVALLFRIVPGLAEHSFGINIAKSVHFRDEVIKNATKILSFLETSSWDHADEFDPLAPKIATTEVDTSVEELKRIFNENKSTANVADLQAKLLAVLPAGI